MENFMQRKEREFNEKIARGQKAIDDTTEHINQFVY